MCLDGVFVDAVKLFISKLNSIDHTFFCMHYFIPENKLRKKRKKAQNIIILFYNNFQNVERRDINKEKEMDDKLCNIKYHI